MPCFNEQPTSNCRSCRGNSKLNSVCYVHAIDGAQSGTTSQLCRAALFDSDPVNMMYIAFSIIESRDLKYTQKPCSYASCQQLSGPHTNLRFERSETAIYLIQI